MARILGIDPALTKTGWGIVEVHNNSYKFIASGLILTDSKTAMADRLKHIHSDFLNVISLYKPDIASIEETFVNVNPASSLKLGHARGAIMLTLALCNIKLFEYSATAIKKSITGVGRAQKQQVEAMINILLPQNQASSDDEADALAAAICHANNQQAFSHDKFANR